MYPLFTLICNVALCWSLTDVSNQINKRVTELEEGFDAQDWTGMSEMWVDDLSMYHASGCSVHTNTNAGKNLHQNALQQVSRRLHDNIIQSLFPQTVIRLSTESIWINISMKNGNVLLVRCQHVVMQECTTWHLIFPFPFTDFGTAMQGLYTAGVRSIKAQSMYVEEFSPKWAISVGTWDAFDAVNEGGNVIMDLRWPTIFSQNLFKSISRLE